MYILVCLSLSLHYSPFSNILKVLECAFCSVQLVSCPLCLCPRLSVLPVSLSVLSVSLSVLSVSLFCLCLCLVCVVCVCVVCVSVLSVSVCLSPSPSSLFSKIRTFVRFDQCSWSVALYVCCPLCLWPSMSVALYVCGPLCQLPSMSVALSVRLRPSPPSLRKMLQLYVLIRTVCL